MHRDNPQRRSTGVAYLTGAFGMERARPVDDIVREVDAALGGAPSAEDDLRPTLDPKAIWDRHNTRPTDAQKGIRR